MLKRMVLVAALATIIATPAFASQCPKLAHEIDAALEMSSLTEAEKSKVMEMREKGMELHNAGQHAESEAVLKEALEGLKSGQ